MSVAETLPEIPGQPDQPLLSILLPAYAYAQGVLRILHGLAGWPSLRCEVLVFDDSPDDTVAQAVDLYRSQTGYAVAYRRNRPALGAVANWNALLDAARGEYVWLLHHDEFPIGRNFLDILLDRLSAKPAVLLLDCLLVDARSGHNRRHLPIGLRLAIARHVPDYVFRRNVIGPASTLVAQRSVYPRFEKALKWKVDVEAYARMFRLAHGQITAVPGLMIGSLLNREASITATLQEGLSDRQRAEHEWVRARLGRQTIWLADPDHGPTARRLGLRFENTAWLTVRLLTRLPWMLGWSSRPKAEVMAAMYAAIPDSNGKQK